MNKKFLPLLPLLLFAGCCFLPAGDPPEGNIVHNPAAGENVMRANNPDEASELFISTLTMAFLEHCPGAEVRIEADDDSAFAARNVFSGCAVISGNREKNSDKVPWVLKSNIKDRIWRMSLEHEKKSVWNSSVQCEFDPSSIL